MLQTWTEFCPQSFAGLEVQTMWMSAVYGQACFGKKMFTNELNMGLPLRAWVEKKVHSVEALWLSIKEIVSIAAVNWEGPANIFLGHERTHHYWFFFFFFFFWKRCDCKQCFLMPTPLAKLSYPSIGPYVCVCVCIYIYIYLRILILMYIIEVPWKEWSTNHQKKSFQYILIKNCLILFSI